MAWEQPEGQVCGRQEAARTSAHVRLGCSGCGDKGEGSAWRCSWEYQAPSCLCSQGWRVTGDLGAHSGWGVAVRPPWQTSAHHTPLHLAQKPALALAGQALPPSTPGIPLEDGRRLSDPQNLPHSPSLCEGMDTYRSQGVFRTQLPESTPAPLLQPHTRPPGGGQGQKHIGGHQEALPRPTVGRPSRCQSHRVSFPPARLGGVCVCVGCLLELGVGSAAHPWLAAPHPTAAEG